MERFIPVLILFGVLSQPAFAERELLDRVVAVVNDEPITQSELDIFLRPLYEEYKKELQDERLLIKLNEARQKLLNQLIEDRLVYQEAKSQAIEVDETEIEADIREFKKRFKDEAAMEDALKKEGLNISTMRERFQRQAMIHNLHDKEIRAKIVVSPLEIENYYKENPQEFSFEERLKVRSITLKKSDEAREKGLADERAKNKIQDLRKKIVAGEDFGKLAEQFSEDAHAKESGLWDWVRRGDVIAEIGDVLFKLKTGEVSDLIETSMGVHLFRVEERQEGRKRSFEEVRDEIFSLLYRQKGAERFREWMQELKRKAYIAVR